MKEFFCLIGVLLIGALYSNLMKTKKSRILYWVGVAGCILFAFGMTGTRVFRTSVFFCGMYNLVFFLALCVNKIPYGRYFQYFIWGIPTLLFAVVWTYFLANGTRFGALDILAIMQTNLSEAASYCLDNANVLSVVALILVVVEYFWYCRGLGKERLFEVSKIGICVLIAILEIGLFATYKTRNNIFRDTKKMVVENLKEYSKFREKVDERRVKFTQHGVVTKNSDADGLYVLIIGESHNRDNMHAYGYGRETTPWLDSVKNSENTLFFSKSFSCHTHTVPVLSYALTAKNQYNQISFGNAVSVIELANAAGYDTYWLSNQVKCGAWDTPISVIADGAKRTNWLNKNLGATTKTNCYDIDLIGELEKIDVRNNSFVVIHMMDCHGSYGDRYPQEYAKFGNRGLDEYDNAILYNDYVIRNVYEKVRNLPNFMAMLYLSDHADAPLDGVAHDFNCFVPGMSHIPMYMIVSDDFKKKQGNVFNNLKLHSDSVWTNDLLFNMLLSVMGIDAKEVQEPHNDLASPMYDGNVARFRTGHGKKKIIEDSMFCGLQRPDKYWLHRMNHIDNLSNTELLNKYKGIEIDIRYEKGKNDFDVNHDAHGCIDNSLRQYLSKMQPYSHKIWLDFKNLDENNAECALNLLTDILKNSGIEISRVVVESHSLSGNKIFRDAGYYTSFYLPYYKLDEMTEGEKIAAQKKIYEIGKSGAVDAISFPAYEYEFVASVKGIENIDMLTWESGGGPRGMWAQSYYSDIGKKMLEDNRVKVILVDDPVKKFK